MKIRTRLLLLILLTVFAVILSISFLTEYAWFYEPLSWLIVFGALLTVILVMIGVAVIANTISQPVEQLKNAALTLAAGNYGKKIEVKGPQEITELANTLNTMSECLREHLTRLEETSLLREKMIGEVECVRILQSKLLQGIAESFTHPEISIRAIAMSVRQAQKTMCLEIAQVSDTNVKLKLKEANFVGFDGIYELMTQVENSSFIELSLTKQGHTWKFEDEVMAMPQPLVFSVQNAKLTNAKNGTVLQKFDFALLISSNLDELIQQESSVHQSLERVFRHFAEDGIDACTTLLTGELAFLAQKYELRTPLQAVLLQIQPQELYE